MKLCNPDLDFISVLLIFVTVLIYNVLVLWQCLYAILTLSDVSLLREIV